MSDIIKRELSEYKAPDSCVIQFMSNIPILQASMGQGEGQQIIDTGDD